MSMRKKLGRWNSALLGHNQTYVFKDGHEFRVCFTDYPERIQEQIIGQGLRATFGGLATKANGIDELAGLMEQKHQELLQGVFTTSTRDEIWSLVLVELAKEYGKEMDQGIAAVTWAGMSSAAKETIRENDKAKLLYQRIKLERDLARAEQGEESDDDPLAGLFS